MNYPSDPNSSFNAAATFRRSMFTDPNVSRYSLAPTDPTGSASRNSYTGQPLPDYAGTAYGPAETDENTEPGQDAKWASRSPSSSPSSTFTAEPEAGHRQARSNPTGRFPIHLDPRFSPDGSLLGSSSPLGPEDVRIINRPADQPAARAAGPTRTTTVPSYVSASAEPRTPTGQEWQSETAVDSDGHVGPNGAIMPPRWSPRRRTSGYVPPPLGFDTIFEETETSMGRAPDTTGRSVSRPAAAAAGAGDGSALSGPITLARVPSNMSDTPAGSALFQLWLGRLEGPATQPEGATRSGPTPAPARTHTQTLLAPPSPTDDPSPSEYPSPSVRSFTLPSMMVMRNPSNTSRVTRKSLASSKNRYQSGAPSVMSMATDVLESSALQYYRNHPGHEQSGDAAGFLAGPENVAGLVRAMSNLKRAKSKPKSLRLGITEPTVTDSEWAVSPVEGVDIETVSRLKPLRLVTDPSVRPTLEPPSVHVRTGPAVQVSTALKSGTGVNSAIGIVSAEARSSSGSAIRPTDCLARSGGEVDYTFDASLFPTGLMESVAGVPTPSHLAGLTRLKGSPNMPTTTTRITKAAARPAQPNFFSSGLGESNSVTSLPDLILRAETLATNLHAGRTASQIEPESGGRMPPSLTVHTNMSTLSPPLPIRIDNGRPWTGTRSGTGSRSESAQTTARTADSFSVGPFSARAKEIDSNPSSSAAPSVVQPRSVFEDDKPKRRWWTFSINRRRGIIMIGIVSLLLILVAIMVPVGVMIGKKNRDASAAAAASDTSDEPTIVTPELLTQCRAKTTCLNGGFVMVTTDNACSCSCPPMYTGATCSLQTSQTSAETASPSSSSTPSAGSLSCISIPNDSTGSTIGSELLSIIQSSSTSYGISLSATVVSQIFNRQKTSCAAQNAIITFDSPTTSQKRSLSSNSRLIRHSPRSTLPPTRTIVDFARTVVLYTIQQSGLVSVGVAVQSNLETALTQLNVLSSQDSTVLTSASNPSWTVDVGNGYKVFLDTLKVQLPTGETVGKGYTS